MSSTAPESVFARATEVTKHLRSSLPSELHRPHVAIVCGSGLGGLQHTISPSPRAEFAYESLPYFPVSTVQGHEGKMVFGMIGKVPVLLLVGRAHFYEGHSMELCTFATRVCRTLDIQTMIMTNAAGGLNPSYPVGSIVMLHDHINLAGLVGTHPLRGANETSFGPRFPALSDAYDLSLRRRAHLAWRALALPGALHEGVYAFAGGPSYETRAECRMLRALGADVVGMSTVPEILVARHCGMRVLAFSLVTNVSVLQAGPRGDDEGVLAMSDAELQAYLAKGMASHEEVLEAGRAAAETMQSFVKKIVEDLDGR